MCTIYMCERKKSPHPLGRVLREGLPFWLRRPPRPSPHVWNPEGRQMLGHRTAAGHTTGTMSTAPVPQGIADTRGAGVAGWRPYADYFTLGGILQVGWGKGAMLCARARAHLRMRRHAPLW